MDRWGRHPCGAAALRGRVQEGALRQAHAERDAAAAGLKVILNNVSAQVNLAYNAIATDRERHPPEFRRGGPGPGEPASGARPLQ